MPVQARKTKVIDLVVSACNRHLFSGRVCWKDCGKGDRPEGTPRLGSLCSRVVDVLCSQMALKSLVGQSEFVVSGLVQDQAVTAVLALLDVNAAFILQKL